MCSFSPAPVRPEQQALVKGWVGSIGLTPDLHWETFGQYLDMLRALRPSPLADPKDRIDLYRKLTQARQSAGGLP